jgi:hypothetical protein
LEVRTTEKSFIDETKLAKEEPFLANGPFVDEDNLQGFDMDINVEKEDELDLSAFEMEEPEITMENQEDDNNIFSLNIEDTSKHINLEVSEFPEIDFETKFINEEEDDNEVVEENQFIPSILQNEVDDEIISVVSKPDNAISHDLDEFSLDLELNEFSSESNAAFSDESISFIPDHSEDNEVGELDLDFSFSDEFEKQKKVKFEEKKEVSLPEPKIESKLSIKPVPDSFDTSLLNEIENHEEDSDIHQEEESVEEIPEFKTNIKNNRDNNISAEEKDKVNLNIPIPTLTFVEVLQNQKLYDQALEILDLLEKRSSDKEKIIRKKEEIIKLKSLENY